MTVATALLQGTRLLEDGSVAAPRLTAEVLLAHALDRERPYLYAHPEESLSEVAWIHFGRYLHERLGGKPTQYITHRQEFYGRPFRVTSDVLIPRPETEHVVEAVLDKVAKGAIVTDVGCGSGAIAVTLALESDATVYATDVSRGAIAVARENATWLGARVHFVHCDLAAPFAGRSLDMVVSNPPYVSNADGDGLQREVRDWEPRVALFAGPTGLEIYERLVVEAERVLKLGGHLIVELGYQALEPVKRMLGTRWSDLETRSDLAGLPRVFAARLVS